MKYSENNFDELCEWEGIVRDGGGWSNDTPKFDFTKFPCYCCLKKYDTWEESRECRKKDFEQNPNMIPAQMVR